MFGRIIKILIVIGIIYGVMVGLKYWKTQLYLAKGFDLIGFYEQAEKFAFKAEKLFPKNEPEINKTLIYLTLARIYYDKYDWDRAAIQLKKILELDPGNNEASEMLKEVKKHLRH